MNYGEAGYVAEAVLCGEMLKRVIFLETDDNLTTILSKHLQTGWRPANQKVVTAVFEILVHKKSFPVYCRVVQSRP